MFFLTDEEVETLKDLHNKGYTFIARDEDGYLYAYDDEDVGDITPFAGKWENLGSIKELDSEILSFIEWSDDEATSIDGILRSYMRVQ